MSQKSSQKYSLNTARPSVPQKWIQPDLGSMTASIGSGQQVSAEYVYPGSVVMVLFGLALVLTSLVSLFRQRYINGVKHNCKNNNVKARQHMSRAVVCTLASTPLPNEPVSGVQPARLKVRRQPCSLERFTQIEHAIDAAIAGVLERRFEIGLQDWALIKGFWDAQVTHHREGIVVANSGQLFEPVSVDDYVEIKMTLSRTTEEVLNRVFNLTLNDWLRIRLYWYQKFAKDEALTETYQNSRAKQGLRIVPLAA
jgi:hypothetical protein